jgi:hypothetical protein
MSWWQLADAPFYVHLRRDRRPPAACITHRSSEPAVLDNFVKSLFGPTVAVTSSY